MKGVRQITAPHGEIECIISFSYLLYMTSSIVADLCGRLVRLPHREAQALLLPPGRHGAAA
jgi:hypothetical protein